MAVTGGDVFDVIDIEEAVCRRVVSKSLPQMMNRIGPMIELWGTPLINVHFKSLSAEERFNPVNYSSAGGVISENS